ncbi:MAG: response regulator [Deltaproteobacteria bacterium]|nr:response regulator [Deltaproteobacteria bacterium]
MLLSSNSVFFASIIILTILIFFLITNIVTRRRAEKALRKSQERMKAILKASPVGICLVLNRKLDWANEMMYRMTGYEQGSRIGQSVGILYTDDKEYDRVGRELYDDIEKTGIGHAETRLVRKDGTTFDCRIQACNLDPIDSVKGQIIAITDISKTKLFEAQLLQACKMEAVGTLAGGISHDFNNLLQAIMGYTQLLLLKQSKEDPGFAQLKQIEKSAQRGGELTRRLLTFSRNIESKPKPLNLNFEIKRIYTILKRTIPRMIDIELILEDDLKNINADPIQMEQILMNLGVNSRDAMPDGGKLIFETKNVVLDEEYFKTNLVAMPGEYVMLSIADTGCGMGKETMEHIYEPFFTTKQVGKGTGLGLAMVYGIVESHGGYITSYSKPDEGSIFRIYFPVLREDVEMQAIEKQEEEIHDGSETILLVDDEETVLDIAKGMLEHFGYTAITAESGEDAIEIFKKSKPYPDLVILDVGMPGMGGHKCLKELLKIYPEIKVIIASGYSENGKVEKTVESGAAGFIAKPYHLVDMVKKVREILDSE